MLSQSGIDRVVEQTKAIVDGLGLKDSTMITEAKICIASSLILSEGFETLSDVGPAIDRLAEAAWAKGAEMQKG